MSVFDMLPIKASYYLLTYLLYIHFYAAAAVWDER